VDQVLISGSESFPRLSLFGYLVASATVWGVWPVCMTSCLPLTGLEMEFAFFPSSSHCMATKASTLWDTAFVKVQ